MFLLILLTIGLMLFLRHYYAELLIAQGRGTIKDVSNLNEASRKMDYIFAQKSKIVIFLFVPFAALNSFIVFRRKHLNLSEHSIVAGLILLGILLISTLGNAIFYFDLLVEFSNGFADFISVFITGLTFLYIGFGYFNAFGADYTKWGFAFRILLFFILLFIEMVISLFVTVGFITNWDFGDITITPFG